MRRPTVTVSESKSSTLRVLSMVTNTSERESCLRCSVPAKMMSSIFSPRSCFACFSPRTHLMASTTLDFPHPFGPMITVMPGSKLIWVLSANDLNPYNSMDRKNIVEPVR